MNGKYNNLVESGRAILLTIMCFIMAVSVALFIVINISPLFIDLTTPILHLTKEAVSADYWRIIRYLQLPWLRELRLQHIPITGSAIHHFQDVRRLFLFNELTMVISPYFVIKGLKIEKRQAQLWRLSLPFQMLFILAGFTAFVLFTNFNSYFIRFHYIVFNNMDWVFTPQANPVILLMPESFFSTLFGLLVVISISITIGIWIWIQISLRTFLRKL